MQKFIFFPFTPITRQSLLRLRESGTVCHFLNFVTEESCSETNLITLLVGSKFQTHKTTRYFNKVVSNFRTKIHLPQKLIKRKTRHIECGGFVIGGDGGNVLAAIPGRDPAGAKAAQNAPGVL